MKTILTRSLKKLIALIAVVTSAMLIALYFFLHLVVKLPIEEIRTIMFIAVSVDSIFFAFSIKNLHQPVWHINPFTNKYLLFALGASMLGVVIALLAPPLQQLLSLAPPTMSTFLLLLILGVVNLAIIESAKYIIFHRERRKEAREV